MTTYVELIPLLDLRDSFDELAGIAEHSVGEDKGKVLKALNSYALKGVHCALLIEGGTGETVGYLLYGHVDKFVPWQHNLRLKMKLNGEGIKEAYTTCHIHILSEYLGKGETTKMQRAYSADVLKRGGTHVLLWGYATDQLEEFSFTRPGAVEFPEIKDHNGRRVGVRDLRVFLGAGE